MCRLHFFLLHPDFHHVRVHVQRESAAERLPDEKLGQTRGPADLLSTLGRRPGDPSEEERAHDRAQCGHRGRTQAEHDERDS